MSRHRPDCRECETGVLYAIAMKEGNTRILECDECGERVQSEPTEDDSRRIHPLVVPWGFVLIVAANALYYGHPVAAAVAVAAGIVDAARRWV